MTIGLKSTLLISLPLIATSCGSDTEPKSPNIIYILADDLGYGELGCYGQKLIETPNIDALAARGMRFTQNYSGMTVSAPSRCITLTGLHSGHAYVRGNDEMSRASEAAMLKDSTLEGQRPMPAGTVTISKLLQEAGYATGMVGKWGLGYPGSESTPNKMGFDFFYGFNCQRQAHNLYPAFLYRNEQREYLPNKLLTRTGLDKGADPMDVASYAKYTQEAYSCDLMYDEMLGFVERNYEEPFFLAWTTPIPHAPLQVPGKWVDYYVDKFGDEEPYLGERGYYPCRYPKATYAAMVSYFDEQVGGLIQKLKDLGVYENTIIMLTSDNGPTFNGGTESPWFESAGPFKSEYGWGKCFLREGGIRVPMIVAWDGVVEAGSTSDHVSASWDVMATVCEIVDIPTPVTDGISYVNELKGEPQEEHEYLYWEFPELGGDKAVRMGKWKGLVQNIKKEGEGNLMLFDLELDPQEQNNIAAQHPEIIEKIRAIMVEAHTPPLVKAFEIKRKTE